MPLANHAFARVTPPCSSFSSFLSLKALLMVRIKNSSFSPFSSNPPPFGRGQRHVLRKHHCCGPGSIGMLCIVKPLMVQQAAGTHTRIPEFLPPPGAKGREEHTQLLPAVHGKFYTKHQFQTTATDVKAENTPQYPKNSPEIPQMAVWGIFRLFWGFYVSSWPDFSAGGHFSAFLVEIPALAISGLCSGAFSTPRLEHGTDAPLQTSPQEELFQINLTRRGSALTNR